MNSSFRFFSAIWLLIKACLVYFLTFLIYGFLYGLLPNASDSAVRASSFACGIIVSIIYVSISSKSDRHMRSALAIWGYIHQTPAEEIYPEGRNDDSNATVKSQQNNILKPDKEKAIANPGISMLKSDKKNLDEYKMALDKRAEELQALQNELIKRENDIEIREKEFEQKRRAAAIKLSAEANNAEEATTRMDTYMKALMRAEARTLEWIERREKEDLEIFNEIKEDVEKFTKYSQPEMTGFDFESHVAELLRGNGFTDVEVTPKSQDFGADIVGCLKGAKYVFQCKYYSSPVGIDAVQQIYSAKIHYDAHVPVVVTNSVFTKAAKILAEEVNVLLWDCESVAEMEAKSNTKPPLEPSAAL